MFEGQICSLGRSFTTCLIPVRETEELHQYTVQDVHGRREYPFLLS